jgi:NADPH2:quinone reductase
MKAYVLTDAGPAIRDTPKVAPRQGQVSVKVEANALNRVDLAMASGAMHGARGGVGTVLGSEWSGQVEAVGAEVTDFAVGDRVMGASASSFAEYVCVHAAHVLKIPESSGGGANMGFEEATCFPVAMRTMHDAIVTAGQLQPGETVLIQGASSGVGLLGMQIAKVMGAKAVIGSSTDPERRSKLSNYGADLAIDTTDPAWVDAVVDYTMGQGVELIVDQVSGGLVNGNLRAARIKGRIVNVGRLGGTRTEFDADLHALRRITYIGVTFRTRTLDEVAEINRRAVADLWAPLSAGQLKLPVDSVFAFADVDQALGRMARNQHFGKIVLKH